MLGSRGSKAAQIVVLGESPTSTDLGMKRTFSGGTGTLVDAIVDAIPGLERPDLYYANAMLCNYPNGVKLTQADFAACNERLIQELSELQNLRVIIACGNGAKTLLGDIAITKEMFNIYWNDRLNCFVIPTYHPSLAYKDPDAFPDICWAFETAKMLVDGGHGKEFLIPPKLNVRVATDQEEAENFLSELASYDGPEPMFVSIDCEADNVEWQTTGMLAIGWATSATDVTITPFVPLPVANPDPRDFAPSLGMITQLHRVAANPHLIKIFHNGDFDVKLIYRNSGALLSIDEDTLLSDFTVDERGGNDDVEGMQMGRKIGSHRLKVSARRFLHVPDWEKDIKRYLTSSKTPYSYIPRPRLYEYLAYDCAYTYRLCVKHFDVLQEEQPSALDYEMPYFRYRNVMIPAQNEIVRMELDGIRIDKPLLDKLNVEAELRLAELERDMLLRVREIRGTDGPPALVLTKTGKVKKNQPTEFNPRSNQQVAEVIYGDLGIVPNADLRTAINGSPIDSDRPVGRDTLLKIKRSYLPTEPFVDSLLEHKDLSRKHGTYIQGLLKRLDGNYRVHGQFLLTVTRTARLSSRDPNLQNQYPAIKPAYLPDDEDSVFFNSDFKQLEVRVAGYFSRDPKLIEACKGDIHGAISRDIFAHIYSAVEAADTLQALMEICAAYQLLNSIVRAQMDPRQATTDVEELRKRIKGFLRQSAKPIVFGVLYGREAYSLAHGPLACSEREAQGYIDGFFAKYSKLAGWLDDTKKFVQKHQWLETPTGYRRRFPLLTTDFIRRVLKQTVNAPVQSFASDICLTAFTNLAPKLREAGYGAVRILVHDAIAGSLKKEHVEAARALIIDEMQTAWTDPEIAFPVDFAIGINYAEAK